MIDKNQEIKDLLTSSQEGNQVAFGRLYSMYADTIYRFIFFRVSDQETAQDLTSDVFIKVWKTIPHYVADPKVKFSTWLFTIAKNRVIDHYRTVKKNVNIDDVAEIKIDHANDLNRLSASFDLDKVKEILLTMKPEYSLVIELKYFQELDYPEIAKILNKSEVGARVLIHRATSALKKKIEL